MKIYIRLALIKKTNLHNFKAKSTWNKISVYLGLHSNKTVNKFSNHIFRYKTESPSIKWQSGKN